MGDLALPRRQAPNPIGGYHCEKAFAVRSRCWIWLLTMAR